MGIWEKSNNCPRGFEVYTLDLEGENTWISPVCRNRGWETQEPVWCKLSFRDQEKVPAEKLYIADDSESKRDKPFGREASPLSMLKKLGDYAPLATRVQGIPQKYRQCFDNLLEDINEELDMRKI
ncbi:hypothetical protein COV15_00010 [Candidatus Woesearchaeota archaeon CG10_big_fil_rev_8_21_14_0_10_34_12]|nr:MAG: hypothetical protein COV15_00010 [Candidatus Woesearchaeota archaeon CG10_big_fil_rev_8_21_14_0_10_34_12]